MSDKPRFLAKAGATRDYVADPAHGIREWDDEVTDKEGNKGGWIPEPEAVPKGWLNEESKKRGKVWTVARSQELVIQQDQSIANALRKVRVEGRRQGVDLERQMSAIWREIDEARRRLGI